MSTYWGYVCLDCGVATTHWINHGDQVLSALLYGYGVKRHERPDPAWIHLRIPATGDGPGEFIFDHWGHQLALQNEYGEQQLVVAPPVCAVVDCRRVATRRITLRSVDRDDEQLVTIAVCEDDFNLHPTRSDYRQVGG